VSLKNQNVAKTAEASIEETTAGVNMLYLEGNLLNEEIPLNNMISILDAV